MLTKFNLTALLTLQLLLGISLLGRADDSGTLPIQLPAGKYAFQGDLFKKLLKKSKSFKHNNKEDAAEIKSLKQKGHFCFRKNTEITNCQIKESNFELPEGTLEMTTKRLKSFPILFPADPYVEFSHNGSTTQEWMIHGPTFIGEYKDVRVYRVSKTNEGELFLSFPVDDENPISFLTVRGEKSYGFTLVLQSTGENGWKNYYYYEALYAPIESVH